MGKLTYLLSLSPTSPTVLQSRKVKVKQLANLALLLLSHHCYVCHHNCLSYLYTEALHLANHLTSCRLLLMSYKDKVVWRLGLLRVHSNLLFFFPFNMTIYLCNVVSISTVSTNIKYQYLFPPLLHFIICMLFTSFPLLSVLQVSSIAM